MASALRPDRLSQIHSRAVPAPLPRPRSYGRARAGGRRRGWRRLPMGAVLAIASLVWAVPARGAEDTAKADPEAVTYIATEPMVIRLEDPGMMLVTEFLLGVKGRDRVTVLTALPRLRGVMLQEMQGLHVDDVDGAEDVRALKARLLPALGAHLPDGELRDILVKQLLIY